MHYVDGSNTESYYTAIKSHRLSVKTTDGRINYFDDATVEIAYVLGDKFYKITYAKGGVEYYNPRNIVFIAF